MLQRAPSEKWTVCAFAVIPLAVCAAVNTFNVHGLTHQWSVEPDDFLYCLGVVLTIGAASASWSPFAVAHPYRYPIMLFSLVTIIYSVAGYTVMTDCPGETTDITSGWGFVADFSLMLCAVILFLFGEDQNSPAIAKSSGTNRSD